MGLWLSFSQAVLDATLKASVDAIVPEMRSESAVKSDERAVAHHVANGGCGEDFLKAMDECHPSPAALLDGKRGVTERVVDVKACVKATAALRKCFAGNPVMLKHVYLRRMDKGLDQDLKPSPEEIKDDERILFRWWTGMRRS